MYKSTLNRWLSSCFVVVFICNIKTSSAIESNPNRHVKVVDSGNYKVEWRVDWNREQISFNVTVKTLGFVGLGISKRGHERIDLVIGGVDSNGQFYFSDQHILNTYFPRVDRRQNWILNNASESGTHTSLNFSRAFDTCDPQDVRIDNDTLILHWIYGESDNEFEHFYSKRGSFPIYLLDREFTPFSLTEAGNGEHPKEILGRNVSVWNIISNLVIPKKRTTYWCTIQKLSVPKKSHIVGFNAKANQEVLQNVHHVMLFRCIVPPGMNASALYEPFTDYPGDECYYPGDPNSKIPHRYCSDVKVGYAIGGGSLFLPDHVGFPVGENGPDDYFLMGIHFDNPDGLEDLQARVEVDIYYTDNLRENDGGLLAIGQPFPTSPISPSILIPPGDNDHVIFGHCSPNCTGKMINKEGIKVFGGLLHSHRGVQMKLHHFRGNEELPYILNDDNYVHTYQPFRLSQGEVTILPGDQLTTRCVYNMGSNPRSTVGGFGSNQEMCLTFAVYYKYVPNYAICYSELVSAEYSRRYLGGLTNVTWNQSKLEFEATSPPHLAGLSLSEISDSPYVTWSGRQRRMLQLDHIVHPQAQICPTINEIAEVAAAVAAGVQLTLPPPPTVSYPVQIPRYIPPSTCSAPVPKPKVAKFI